jgi:feruloyl esterase
MAVAALPGRAIVSATPAETSCESLVSLKLPHTTIVSASVAAEGPLTQGRAGGPPPLVVPARCVVKAVSKPSSDSEIQIELWLPVSGWNGKYLQMGNGGWAGSIPTSGLAAGVRRGFATAGTDDGHTGAGDGATWAIGHPEKLIDFGHRAVHETSVQSKAIIQAFYGREAPRRYFFGCSDGGREALMEAQRYPEDFHGIIAGAPANNWTGVMTNAVWTMQALDAAALSPAKLPAVQSAALAACDTLDGLKDGLLEDPRACRFDPAVLTCTGAETDQCLTPPQAAALAKVYAGPKNPRTGAQITAGFPAGTEGVPGGWAGWIVPPGGGRGSALAMFGSSHYGHAVFEDLKWDFRTKNFDSDVAYSIEKTGAILDSNNPDLRSFRANGGRLIQYHGWGDAAIPAAMSIEYYERVRAFFAKYPDARSESRPIESFYRLFMVPGMGHCGGGIGPNTFGNGGRSGASTTPDPDSDLLAALERWVEQGTAPERFIATGTVVGDPAKTLTRPLCPYPKVARYNGTGDPNIAESFTCAVPAARP